jgi:two-component system chemotaxis response regulator CheB
MRGGLTVVQDPESALYPSMPKSALENVAIDHIATLADMATLLTRLVREPVAAVGGNRSEAPLPFDAELQRETAIADVGPATSEDPGYRGQPSGFACPDCHGALWELREGELVRFRCRVGHAFLPQSLSAAMSEQLDEALWIALRCLRENAALCMRLAERSRHRNFPAIATSYEERAIEAKQRAALIEQVLRRGQLAVEPPELTEDATSQQQNTSHGEPSQADRT